MWGGELSKMKHERVGEENTTLTHWQKGQKEDDTPERY